MAGKVKKFQRTQGVYWAGYPKTWVPGRLGSRVIVQEAQTRGHHPNDPMTPFLLSRLSLANWNSNRCGMGFQSYQRRRRADINI